MKFLRIALLALLSGGLLSAQAVPAGAGEQGFTYAANGKSLVLDPHHAFSADEAQLFTAVHEGLYVYDPVTLEPTPALAEKTVRSADKKTYTFTIRSGARFSNGDPIRARDVRASWMRMLSPGEDAEYASLFDVIKGAQDYRTGKAAGDSGLGISAPDDRTLVVELAAPAAHFTKLLCHHTFSVLHPSMLSAKAWEKPVGAPVSGPFSYQSVSADRIVLAKNPMYWDAANVSLPSITLILSDDDKEMTRRFNSGEIQWLAGPVDADTLLDRESIQVTKPLFATNYLFFNCSQKPWNDPRVRQALDLLMPWDSIRTQDRYYDPADSLVSELQGYPKAKAPGKTDKDAALKLLSDAGYPGGQGLPEIVVKLAKGQDSSELGQGLVDAFTEAGLKASLNLVDASGYYDSFSAKDFTIAAMTWIGDFADPLTFLQMWTSSSGLNDPGFSDPAYDALIAKSMSEEGAARYKDLSKAEGILLSTAACMPTYHSIAVNIISPGSLSGWAPNILDIHPFKFLKFLSGPAVQGLI